VFLFQAGRDEMQMRVVIIAYMNMKHVPNFPEQAPSRTALLYKLTKMRGFVVLYEEKNREGHGWNICVWSRMCLNEMRVEQAHDSFATYVISCN
jgi:hypothetical protein